MSLSRPPPTPVPTRGVLQPLWSQTINVVSRGLALVREKGWLLAWDDKHWLYLLNRMGERQGQVRPSGELATACASDDGSAFAAAGNKGQVWWFAPDLTIRWERAVPDQALTAAMDPFGQYLAVADTKGRLQIFDRLGRLVSQVQSPRPLHHLAFIPTAPYLIGSSDFGLVACLDLAGQWVWRDGLVVHTGALAVNSDGEQIVLACFTDGLRRYSVKGRSQGRLSVTEPCRLVALSFDGDLIMVADLGNKLRFLDRGGRTLFTHMLDKPAVALALGPLGDTAYVALAGGTVISLDLREVLRV